MIKMSTSIDDINDLYPLLIHEVLENGEKASPRGRAIRELHNVGFVLNDAHNSIILNPSRKMNYAYAAIEMLGLLRTGELNVEPYTWYNSKMRQFLNSTGDNWDGSYADRIHWYNQLEEMYKVLKADPDSRRAVMSFYNPVHDFHDYESRDICCTLNLIFNIRDGKLNLTGTMRSNDILLGLPYDLTQFTFLQSVLASWLGLEMGYYCHFTANLHAYEDDVEKLKKIFKDTGRVENQWQRMGDWDLPSQIATYEAIAEFFAYDKLVRQGLKVDGTELKHSKFLTNLFDNVTKPFAVAKLAKAA